MSIGGFIGNLPNEQHGVSGKFYVVDSKTIYIEDFNYDGGGPGTKELYLYGPIMPDSLSYMRPVL